jgi:hypothetical protein
MKTKFVLACLLLFSTVLWTLLSSSLSKPQPTIVVKVDTRTDSLWNSTIARYPLPEGIVSGLPSEAAEAGDVKIIASVELIHQTAGSMAVEGHLQLPEDALLLDSNYYVPSAPIWDPRNSIEANEIANVEIIPVDKLTLPDKALAVGGLRIDSPDYPLVEQKILILNWHTDLPPNGEQPEIDAAVDLLRTWYKNLQSEYELVRDAKAPRLSWIGGVGDIMVQRGVQDMLIGNGNRGLNRVFQRTLPILQQQDLLIGNLEGAVTRRGVPTPKSYNFRFSPDVLPALQQAGFNYLSITNNHCYDYGTTGFLDTLKHLREHGIPTSGAGETPQQAHRPAKMRINGTEVAILSVGAYPQEKNGFNGRTQAQVTDNRPGIIFSGPQTLETVRQFSSKNGVDVVVAHGGEEWHDSPSAEQQEFYRACIEAGADIVFAHHPHVLQGMEAYKGGLIAYSLGNFIFPGMYVMPRAEESLILSTGFYGSRMLYVVPYPVRIDNRVVDLEDESGAILARFLELTQQLN